MRIATLFALLILIHPAVATSATQFTKTSKITCSNPVHAWRLTQAWRKGGPAAIEIWLATHNRSDTEEALCTLDVIEGLGTGRLYKLALQDNACPFKRLYVRMIETDANQLFVLHQPILFNPSRNMCAVLSE